MAPVPLETIRGWFETACRPMGSRQLVGRQVLDSLLSDSFASLLANGSGQLVGQRFCTGVVGQRFCTGFVGQRFCTALSKMALYRRYWPKVLYSIVG